MTERSWPLPAAMARRAARFTAEGGVPAAPRVAATVVLLRPAGGVARGARVPGRLAWDAAEPAYAKSEASPAVASESKSGGYEVYAIRRAAGMAFGGMYAFPGGGVDPADSDAGVGWAGHPAGWWADRLRLPEPQARAVVCAAAREVFEEAGVLLAGPTPDAVVADAGEPRWEAARRSLVDRRTSLSEFLAEAGLYLRSDLLVPWSRWITPEFEARRFDAYFFLALLPAGQLTRDVSGEADHTLWIRPADAVARYAAGELPMLPPTVVTLRQLAEHPDAPAVLAAAADRDPAEPVRPRLVLSADGTAALVV